MHKKTPRYTWIILILIPLIGIAFILYRKASHRSTTATQQYTPQEEIQPIEETPQEPSDNFFNYTEPEEEQIAPEEKPIEVAQPEVKQPDKKTEKHKKPKKEKAPAQKPVKPIKPAAKETKKIEEVTPQVTTQEKKEIKLIIDMTKKSLAYKYLFINYSPSKWELKIDNEMILTFDGKHLTQVKDSILIDPEKPITAHFDFEFLGGRRLGWKEVMYQIDKNTDAIHLNFDWKDPQDYQILITPAQALSKKGHNNHEGAR